LFSWIGKVKGPKFFWIQVQPLALVMFRFFKFLYNHDVIFYFIKPHDKIYFMLITMLGGSRSIFVYLFHWNFKKQQEKNDTFIFC
jgi:hypothetical protein